MHGAGIGRGLERMVSLGSVWDLDWPLCRYRRMPRTEQPRSKPQWGDDRAGPCEDFVWHSLKDAWVTEDGHRFVIVPGDATPFWGPMTEAGFTLTWDLDSALGARGHADWWVK